jgi:carboxylesterase type B
VNRPIRGSTRLVESGEDQGVRFADALACQDEPDVLACMRSRPLPRILDTLRGRQGLLDDGETYGIVIDGLLLPDGPLRAAETGSVARPLFAGANADEGLIFTAGAPITTEQAYRTVLTPFALLLRTTVQALFDLYPPEAYGGSLNAAWAAFYGDFAFVCPTRAFLQAAAPNLPARGYFFARPLLGIEATGAFHGAELGYVFGTLAPVAPAADQQLALAMQAAWTSAAGSSPTWDGAPWPLVSDAWAEVRADGALATVADLAAASRCEALTP